MPETDASGNNPNAPKRARQLAPGNIFAQRYRILSILGYGGMGVVYKAENMHLERSVAVKTLFTELGTDSEEFRRFQHEAKAIATLRHPNIVNIQDFAVEDNQAFLVMDFLDGIHLDDAVDKYGPMGLDIFRHIFSQACDALQHAHAKGIAHRDLKGSNMMMVYENKRHDVLKLVDFGLAKILTDDEDELESKAGMIVGSPLYMAPEQACGLPCDQRSDIYSLAVVMYRCLTTFWPFEGENAVETIRMQVLDLPPPFAEVNPNVFVPQSLQDVIMKALSKNPDERQQSMQELLEEMTEALRPPEPEPTTVVDSILSVVEQVNDSELAPLAVASDSIQSSDLSAETPGTEGTSQQGKEDDWKPLPTESLEPSLDPTQIPMTQSGLAASFSSIPIPFAQRWSSSRTAPPPPPGFSPAPPPQAPVARSKEKRELFHWGQHFQRGEHGLPTTASNFLASVPSSRSQGTRSQSTRPQGIKQESSPTPPLARSTPSMPQFPQPFRPSPPPARPPATAAKDTPQKEPDTPLGVAASGAHRAASSKLRSSNYTPTQGFGEILFDKIIGPIKALLMKEREPEAFVREVADLETQTKQTLRSSLLSLGVLVLGFIFAYMFWPRAITPEQAYAHLDHLYKSADGRMTFRIIDKHCEFQVAKDTRYANYGFFLNDWRDALAVSFSSPFQKQYWLYLNDDCLIDDKNNLLYSSSSPEASLLKQVDLICEYAAACYEKEKKYPDSATKLTSEFKLDYTNPIDKEDDVPRFQTLTIGGGKENGSKDREKLYSELVSGGTWKNAPQLRPGQIRCCAVRFVNGKGDTQGFIVQIIGRDGKPLQAYRSGTSFFRALENGKEYKSPAISEPEFPISAISGMQQNVVWYFITKPDSTLDFCLHNGVLMAFFAGVIGLFVFVLLNRGIILQHMISK